VGDEGFGCGGGEVGPEGLDVVADVALVLLVGVVGGRRRRSVAG
jgi:hypothetical protein